MSYSSRSCSARRRGAIPSLRLRQQEQFRILFLDKRNQIIADEVQQAGTVDHTPV